MLHDSREAQVTLLRSKLSEVFYLEGEFALIQTL
jgi:hypothetical protein